MKSHTEYLWFNTKKHREFINITDEVEKALAKSQIKEGLILVSAMHITAGIYVNDAEDGLIADIDEWAVVVRTFVKKTVETGKRGKGTMTRIRVDDLHKDWMKDPKYRREYEALEEEFSLVAALIEARTRAGLTQEQVAHRMKTTQAVIARLESGDRSPPRAPWSVLRRPPDRASR